MTLSQSARENGWATFPADVWNEHKGSPVGPHRFWIHCVEKYGGPILEVGCGNGRWLLPLSERGPGCEAVGVDINEELIATARQRAQQRAEAGRQVNANFVVGDVVQLDLGRTFPLVIMTSWTFDILLTQDDQIAFLERVREHLRPGGAFAFNAPIPFHTHRAIVEKGVRWQMPARTNYPSGTYDPVSQVVTRRQYDAAPIQYRYTSLSEFQLLFRLTGFKLVEIYGDDEDMRPFTGRAGNDYTVIAERA